MKRLDRDFQDMVSTFETVDLERADNGQILAHYRNLLEMVTDKWDLTLVNDMYAFLFTGLLKSRLRSKEKAGKIRNAEETANRCISGISPAVSSAWDRPGAARQRRGLLSCG